MADDFFKFPRTPHLLRFPDSRIREDRVLSEREREEFLSGVISVEEKLDGANVGISVSDNGSLRIQNRGSYIERPLPEQFERLWPWLAERLPSLLKHLEPRHRIFGEWCFAVHSVRYVRLPDWFLGFDVYDTMSRLFWSSARRNELLSLLGIQPVPEIARGQFDTDTLAGMVSSLRSAYGDEPVEGLYLRREVGGFLQYRAKLVRPGFIQRDEPHWTSRPIEKNMVLGRR